MEYKLNPTFAIYTNNLKILTNDHMKSAGDLHLPITGIGLLWDEGYTRQMVGVGGAIEDQYPRTARDVLRQIDARVEVTVHGKKIPLRTWRVDHYLSSTLYLLKPERDKNRWITQRLYNNKIKNQLTQEILLGIDGVRLLTTLGEKTEVFHFNEGHAVFAGLELLRQQHYGGTTLSERIDRLRAHVVFTTHTPVPAGNEVHDLDLMRKMDADLGFTDAELEVIGGDPFSMTIAGLRLARIANGVAELHGQTAREMWKHVDGAAPIVSMTNKIHQPTWQDARIRAALVPDKPRERQDTKL